MQSHSSADATLFRAQVSGERSRYGAHVLARRGPRVRLALCGLLGLAMVLPIAAAATPGAMGGQPRPSSDPVKIALTFDDLPVHGPLPAGETRVGIAKKI